MASDRELLVHLGGYGSIAAVLATAEWATLLAPVLVLPIVTAALYLAGRLLVEWLVSRARRLEGGQPAGGPVAADGGDGHGE